MIRDDSLLAKEFWKNGKVADCPIYDMHAHMGKLGCIYFPYADPAEMLHMMDRSGVKKLIFSHHSLLFGSEYTDAEVIELIRPYGDRFGLYVTINPNHPDMFRQSLKNFNSWCPLAVGLKIFADYHKVPVDSSLYVDALEFADAHHLPVLYHTWSHSPFNGQDIMRKVIEKYPNIIHLLGHSLNPNWQAATQLIKDFPDNVYLELTSIPGTAGVLEYFRDEIGTERILFGTDLPWFDEHQAIGGLLSTSLNDNELRNIFYRNAKRVLNIAEDRE